MNDFIKLYERRNRIKTFLMALTALLLSLLAISVLHHASMTIMVLALPMTTARPI